MNGQQLKNSILQMAVQGKLVPQDPNDEPASVLVERIRAEKEHLIKEKKIKKEKNPSYIFRGADNLPYEQIWKNEPVCIADEVPFDIPDTWEWIRLKNCIHLISGTSYKKSDVKKEGIRILRGGNIQDFNLRLEDSDVFLDDEYADDEKNIQKGDIILVASTGSKTVIGKPAPVNDNYPKTQIGAFLRIARPILEDVIEWSKIIFKSDYYRSHIRDSVQGTNINNIKAEHIEELLIPLPPYGEQLRIAEQLSLVEPIIATYSDLDIMLDTLNTAFPDRLKKSILQWAVQGKLVPQNPSDEPASVLLERIREEKAYLVKEGKIKKDKNESIIFRRDNSHYEKSGQKEHCIDEEIPFDIPDSWEWVRFSEIAVFENGDRSSKYPVESDYVDDGIPFFGAKDMGDKYMTFDNVRFITQDKFNQLGNGKLMNGDLICLLRGNVGKTRIFMETEKYHTGFICAQMMIIRCINPEMLNYLYAVISSPYYTKTIESKITGTAVRQLPAKEVARMMIPVPPVKEQTRITNALVKAISPLEAL